MRALQQPGDCFAAEAVANVRHAPRIPCIFCPAGLRLRSRPGAPARPAAAAVPACQGAGDRHDDRRACASLRHAGAADPRGDQPQAPVPKRCLRARRLSLPDGDRALPSHLCRYSDAIACGDRSGAVRQFARKALKLPDRPARGLGDDGVGIVEVFADRRNQARVAAVAGCDQAVPDHPLHANPLDR